MKAIHLVGGVSEEDLRESTAAVLPPIIIAALNSASFATVVTLQPEPETTGLGLLCDERPLPSKVILYG